MNTTLINVCQQRLFLSRLLKDAEEDERSRRRSSPTSGFQRTLAGRRHPVFRPTARWHTTLNKPSLTSLRTMFEATSA